MSLEFKLIGEAGKDSTKRQVHVHPFETVTGIHQGFVSLVHPFLNLDPEFHPFLNEVNGTKMSIDAGFSGNAALIHNGSTTTSAASGTTTSIGTAEINDTGATFTGSVSVGMTAVDSGAVYSHVTVRDSDIKLTLDGAIDFGNGEAYTVGAEWTAAAVAGTWNFSGDISLTDGDDGDRAQFNNPGTSVMSNYVAVTGKVTLTTWNEVNNSMNLSFALANVPVGNSVDLNDYIDTGLLGTQQSFVIPKADLGLSGQTVDDMNLVLSRTGGAKAVIDFDDIQLEVSGGSVVYKATTPRATRFHIDEIRIALADNVSGIITGSTTTYPTMTGLAYDDFMGITSPLANGIVFSRQKDSETVFSITIRQLGDFLATGSKIENAISDGTNTFITLLVKFPKPIILDGNKDDFLSFTINDDLSGLLEFRAAARGAVEI